MFKKHKMPSAQGRNGRNHGGGGTFSSKGFSLVELIVIIAVLAVLIAVLAPSLLSYTERSRAQKDISTMDEVVNAVQLAIADDSCYDEAIKYSCSNNFITYTDSSGKYGQQELDGEYWAPDGSGKATTITFNPETDANGNTIYKLENGIVNDMTYGNGSVAKDRIMEGAHIENNQCYLKNMTYLYNAIRKSVGNDVITASSTYKNSSFTIFIKFSQKDGVKVADVHGAFNGTNLNTESQASKGSGTSSYNPDTGDAQVTITTPGKQEAIFTQSDLSGSASFTGTKDYKSKDSFDLLAKDNEFYFYSSINLATSDVSSATLGTLSDLNSKDNAIAGVYINDSGIPVVVLLKDTEIATRCDVSSTAILNLNGHTIHSTASAAINSSADLTINGNGGAIVCTPTDINANAFCVYSQSVIINGGTYVVDFLNGAMQTHTIYSKTSAKIYDADVRAFGAYPNNCMAVRASKGIDAKNCTVNVFTIENQNETPTLLSGYAIGFYNPSNTSYSSIVNCDINVAGSCAVGSFDLISGGTHSSRMYTYFLFNTSSGRTILENLTVNDTPSCPSNCYSEWYWGVNGVALSMSNQNIYFRNCSFDYSAKTLCLRVQGGNGEKNCNVYFTNTTFDVQNEGATVTKWLHANGQLNAGHTLYVGRGCNITEENSQTGQDTIIQTDESY